MRPTITIVYPSLQARSYKRSADLYLINVTRGDEIPPSREEIDFVIGELSLITSLQSKGNIKSEGSKQPFSSEKKAKKAECIEVLDHALEAIKNMRECMTGIADVDTDAFFFESAHEAQERINRAVYIALWPFLNSMEY